ncbi:hypothetical protein GYMLUDRAFT_253258 [Collybiopsis luxurians FD-317 M1]|uniref:Unplaced genomic scaffold GYMLUscaffold_181, whole genome shotgun sequence n=1 Tax=Collybiopsis luxurians FD-317 M1 TaxID=944289 RepID=A0A0D0C5Y9_9AGAR|nr:hypothetical protein GYMLUDRAFT_253258 [Collybiopsis luxurians FD-317 M1]
MSHIAPKLQNKIASSPPPTPWISRIWKVSERDTHNLCPIPQSLPTLWSGGASGTARQAEDEIQRVAVHEELGKSFAMLSSSRETQVESSLENLSMEVDGGERLAQLIFHTYRGLINLVLFRGIVSHTFCGAFGPEISVLNEFG